MSFRHVTSLVCWKKRGNDLGFSSFIQFIENYAKKSPQECLLLHSKSRQVVLSVHTKEHDYLLCKPTC